MGVRAFFGSKYLMVSSGSNVCFLIKFRNLETFFGD